MQQRLTALEVEQVAWQETRRTLEADLAEARVAMETAKGGEDTRRRLLGQRLLHTACAAATEDGQAVTALLADSEFVQCRSSTGENYYAFSALLTCFFVLLTPSHDFRITSGVDSAACRLHI